MKIIVSNNIRVVDADDYIKDYAEENLVIENPEYIRNARLGYSNYKTPKFLVFYEINGNDLILPFGCLLDLFKRYPLEIFENRFVLGEHLQYSSNIQLFDYQDRVRKSAVNAKNGIIVMPAGCLIGETKIRLNSCKKGYETTLENAYNAWHGLNKGIRNNFKDKSKVFVRGLKGNRVGLNKIEDILYSGKKTVYELKLENGMSMQLTPEHRVYTENGYVQAQNCLGKNIAIDKNILPTKNIEEHNKIKDIWVSVSKEHPYARCTIDKRRKNECKTYRITLHRAVYEAYINGFNNIEDYINAVKEGKKDLKFIDTSKYCIHHIDGNHSNNAINNLTCITYKQHKEIHSKENCKNFNQGNIGYSKCISFIKIGEKDTYDICCEEKNQSFTANGIIVHNSGKTQTALQIIATIGFKALWITHTIDLLNQSFDRAKTNFKNIGIGKIANGKVEIGTHITFATVQTLANIDLHEYAHEWDVIIVDECHRVCGTPAKAGMFYKVINKLVARYKYGLTATPYRNAKGTEKAMFALLGNTIIELGKEVIGDRVVPAKIIKVETEVKEIPECCIDYDGTIKYSTLTTVLSENNERNDIILDLLKKSSENYVLVLADRVNQMYYLKEKLGYGNVIDGKTKKDLREKAIQEVRDGQVKVLFATYGLAKEGLDIPRLDRLILASPHRDKATIIQAIGRIERKFENKTEPICYDLVDNIKYFNDMFNSRKKYYKKNNNLIIE